MMSSEGTTDGTTDGSTEGVVRGAEGSETWGEGEGVETIEYCMTSSAHRDWVGKKKL